MHARTCLVSPFSRQTREREQSACQDGMRTQECTRCMYADICAHQTQGDCKNHTPRTRVEGGLTWHAMHVQGLPSPNCGNR